MPSEMECIIENGRNRAAKGMIRHGAYFREEFGGVPIDFAPYKPNDPERNTLHTASLQGG